MDQDVIRRPRTRAVRIVTAVAAAVGIALAGAASAAPAWASESGSIYAAANSDRAANGLGALRANGSLASVAQGWAQQMAAAGVMSHNPNVASQVPPGWSRVGENVAHGFASGAATEAGWMNSPGHRANILGDYTDIGVGWVVDAKGSTWAVQVFAKYGAAPAAPAPAPAPAPAQKAPAPAPVAKAAPPAPAAPAPAAPAVPVPAAAAPSPEPTATLRTTTEAPRGESAAAASAASQSAPRVTASELRTASSVSPVDGSWRAWGWLVGPLSVLALLAIGGAVMRRPAS